MPPIALTMGEPAGVGAEISMKAWEARESANLPVFFAIDDPAHLDNSAKALGLPGRTVTINSPDEAPEAFSQGLPVLARPLTDGAKPGQPNPKHAGVIIDTIREAVSLAMKREISAVVTNPVHKPSLVSAGLAHSGLTGFLGELTGPPGSAVMMLAVPGLKVVPLTTHIPLAQVHGTLTRDLIMETARTVAAALTRDFGIAKPRLAVAGLNPHAGDSGLIGQEETDLLAPAIETLRAEGLHIRGPLPADSLFHAEARTTYDAALCMYHDQALIPLKTLDFYGGANVTLGLPIVRTAPDHGTAFDIAGKGVARPDSLIAAIGLAGDIARNRALNAAAE